MSKEILTAEEIAELLSVKPKTVRQWVYQNKIPYFHIGRLLRFKLSSILEWAAQLERQTSQATATTATKSKPRAKKKKSAK